MLEDLSARSLVNLDASQARSQPPSVSRQEQTPGLPRVAEERGLPDSSVKEVVQLLKLLADETRLRILHLLQQSEELNVLELCKRLRQRQPSVSHHLALLRAAGVIELRREGKHNYYRLRPKRLEDVIGRAFAAGPGQPPRISFENFELRYVPIRQEA